MCKESEGKKCNCNYKKKKINEFILRDQLLQYDGDWMSEYRNQMENDYKEMVETAIKNSPMGENNNNNNKRKRES